MLKFAAATKVTPYVSGFSPETFTNQIQAAFWEPCLLVVPDPRADHQRLILTRLLLYCVTQTLICAMWTLPFCTTRGSSLNGSGVVDVAQEVLHMHGTIPCEHPWEVMPDRFFCRGPEEIEKEEQATAEKAVTREEFQGEWTSLAPIFTALQPEVTN